MLYEYAVEPEVLATWANFRYFADRFGSDHGRLISKYPDGWMKLVWDGCTEPSPINKKRIELGLLALRNCLMKTKRHYDGQVVWLQNAIHEHEDEPFHAIIATSSAECDRLISADDINDDTPLWKVNRDGQVTRVAATMAKLAEPLLFHSTELIFVDQHFSPAVKHVRPLTAFLDMARKGKKLSRIEYHLNADDSAAEFHAGLERQCRFLNLANDEAIIFIRWKCKEGGENLHARYVLTNRGGIHFDYGLDEGDGTTAWARMSVESLKQRRERFEPESGCFELVDACKVTRHGIVKVVRDSGKWIEPPPS